MQNFTKAENLALSNGPSLVGSMEQVGQLGLGIKPGALDGATPLVLPPAVVYVTHLPSMWDNPRDGALARVVKSLFEDHAKSVSGIEIGYTMESAARRSRRTADGCSYRVEAYCCSALVHLR